MVNPPKSLWKIIWDFCGHFSTAIWVATVIIAIILWLLTLPSIITGGIGSLLLALSVISIANRVKANSETKFVALNLRGRHRRVAQAAIPIRNIEPDLVFVGVEYADLFWDDHDIFRYVRQGRDATPKHSALLRFRCDGREIQDLKASLTYSDGGVRNLPPIDRGAWVHQEYNSFDLSVGDSAALIVGCGAPPILVRNPQQQVLFGPMNNHYSPNQYGEPLTLRLDGEWYVVTIRLTAGVHDEFNWQYLFRLERVPHITLTFIRKM